MVHLAFAALVAMSTVGDSHTVAASTYYRTFSRAHPVLERIKAGDSVVTKTVDSGGLDEKDVKRSEPFNPLTGPFFVEGAEPGDALVVKITTLRMNRNWGWSAFRLGLFSITPDDVETVYSNQYKPDLVFKGRSTLVPWDIDLVKKTVRLREPRSAKLPMEFPAQPMLGCIGVAPPGDFAPTSGPSGAYGGNLDYNKIGQGSTVILPVYHPGALLFVGDGHALQADGEPTGTGIETSMDIEFTVEVKKGAAPSVPRVETADALISIGSQPEFASALDNGLKMATSDMVKWLTKDYGLEPWAAHLLIGYQGKYDVVTVAGSMALRVPKAALPAIEATPPRATGLEPRGPRPTYFPSLVFHPEEKVLNEIVANITSRQLGALGEPSLWERSREDRSATVYRFVWLGTSEHPTCVRISKVGGEATMRISRHDQHPGVLGDEDRPKLIIDREVKLAPERWDQIVGELEAAKFWDDPTWENSMIADGDRLVIEGMTDGKYHIVDRNRLIAKRDYEHLFGLVLEMAGPDVARSWSDPTRRSYSLELLEKLRR